MSGSVNKVILIGHLGRSPEIRSTQEGKRIASFSIATSTSWTDKRTNEKRQNTEWHSIVIYSDSLSLIVEKYLFKGSKVYVEGALSTNKWTDKQGVERYTTQVVLQGYSAKLVMLSDNKNSKGEQQNEYKQEAPTTDQYATDDIPF